MIQKILEEVYAPYVDKLDSIKITAWQLNNRQEFNFRTIKVGRTETLPNKKTMEYLLLKEPEFTSITSERAKIHAWLLHTSNRLYNQTLLLNLLPEALNYSTPSMLKAAPNDIAVLDAAKLEPGYSLLRKRLLLKAML